MRGLSCVLLSHIGRTCRSGIQPRPAKLSSKYPTSRRAFHEAKARLITINKHGSRLTREVDIYIGELHEAYVMIDRDVGSAFNSFVDRQIGLSKVVDTDRMPLIFYHDTRHFAHKSLPYPRLTLKQDLPSVGGRTASPATLWLWGSTHSITLDGTRDGDFAESCLESHMRLKGTADLLKDM